MRKKILRKITTPSGVWQYKISLCFTRLVSPEGVRSYVNTSDILTANGITNYEFERGQWKRTRDGEITPKMIRTYLDNAYKRLGRV